VICKQDLVNVNEELECFVESKILIEKDHLCFLSVVVLDSMEKLVIKNAVLSFQGLKVLIVKLIARHRYLA
jgi:hypothetical protein